MLLVAMLTGWGLYQWRDYQQALRLEQSALQLQAFLTRLQTDANWRNRAALLWLQPGAHWCVGSGTPVSCQTQTERWLFAADQPGITLHSGQQKEIGFYGMRNNAQAGHMVLANSAGRIRLVLSARGRLRLCSEGSLVRSIPLCQP